MYELSNIKRKIEPLIDSKIKKSLGPEFRINSIELQPGSVEVYLLIGIALIGASILRNPPSEWHFFKNQVKEITEETEDLLSNTFDASVHSDVPHYFNTKDNEVATQLSQIKIILLFFFALFFIFAIILFQHYYLNDAFVSSIVAIIDELTYKEQIEIIIAMSSSGAILLLRSRIRVLMTETWRHQEKKRRI